jgi:hypothetical protein
MSQANVLVLDRPVAAPWILLEDDREIQRGGLLEVLERAAEDDHFIAQLTHGGSEALQGYDLTWREQAALLSGDVRWIEARLGKLDARLRTWLDCRLQQEIW